MTRPVVHLPEHLRQEIIDHCRSELPNEGCGLLAMDGERVVKVYPTSNAEASQYDYTVAPEEHIAALTNAEDSGWVLGGTFHSHPKGSAEPSMTDVRSALEPEWVYLVVGLRGDPELRGWSIRDGGIGEIRIDSAGP